MKYIPLSAPGPGQALVDVQAIGVNFADVSARRGGATPSPSLPAIPGFEAAGLVSAGELKVRISGEFALAEAAEAHRQLEGRLSTGRLLLIP